MQLHLVERAQQGDHEAFASLASANVDRCYAIARRILRDPDRAEDAVQHALLGAWRDLPTLREPERLMDMTTDVSGYVYIVHWIPGS